ncbi:DUF1566 domain-containing protein [bacterium]|nr:DUF1566 domain-containing protein [bacterium]
MKFNSLILLLVSLFVLFSCDSGIKFNNPNDINSDAYNPSDTEADTDDDSDKTDTISEYDEDKTDTVSGNDEEETDTSVPDDDTDTTPADPCDPNPCNSIENSTGDCTVNGTGYICGCNTHYTWVDSLCKAEERAKPCTGKPENASWNTASQIKQTWNGEDWYPSTAGVYNTNASTTECRFKCDTGYNWNGSACVSGGSSLPECSASSGTPCKDSSSGLIWSAKASSRMTWSNAVSYCDNLTEGGYSDWHLPNIDELKTLLIANRVTSNCAVSEANNCLSYSSCWSCSTCTQTGTQSSSGTRCSDWGTSYSDGRYSKFGETGGFWSSSTQSDNTGYAWRVDFGYGSVYSLDKTDSRDVRCVR